MFHKILEKKESTLCKNQQDKYNGLFTKVKFDPYEYILPYTGNIEKANGNQSDKKMELYQNPNYVINGDTANWGA